MAFTPIIGTGFELGTTPPYISGTTSIYSGGIGGSYYGCKEEYNTPYFHTCINMVTSGALTEAYLAMWMKNAFNGVGDGMEVVLSTGQKIDIRSVNGNYGYYDLYINNTKVASSMIPVTVNAWSHFQMHIIVSTTGLVETKVNGYSDINYSGNTCPSGAGTISSVGSCGGSWSNAGWTSSVDNMIFGTGGWPGDFRFEALMPSADTATAQLTPTPTGAHFSTVSERGPSDSTFVLGATNGLRDIYDLTDWSDAEKIPVYLVQHIRAYKTNAGTQGVKFIATLGGVESLSSSLIITTAPVNYYRNLLLAPDGTAWTTAKINALQIGAEVSF